MQPRCEEGERIVAESASTAAGIARRVDHMAFAVADLERALAAYAMLGGEHVFTRQRPQAGYEIGYVMVGQETLITLLHPTGATGPIREFLNTRGEGLHHVALEVDDLTRVVATLRANRVEVGEIKADPGERKEVYVPAGALLVPMVELIEWEPAMRVSPRERVARMAARG